MKDAFSITANGFKFKIIKEADDPLTNRISIGGDKERGCYIVFRGDIADCKIIIENALEAFKKASDKYLTQNN